MAVERIQIENLYKIYFTERQSPYIALDNINLTLHKGEFLSLIGESGSGKSTLAKLIVGLEKPSKGEITIDEEGISSWSYGQWRKRRNKIQGVFQDATGTLNLKKSVYANLEQALINLSSLNAKERSKRIEDLMYETNLDMKLLEVPTGQLSGGEQRRISLLRALSIKPKYLILDEFTSGLDLISADAVLSLIEQYHKVHQCGCLFITHDMNQAYRMSDRIVEIKNGRLTKSAIKERNEIRYEQIKENYWNGALCLPSTY